MARRFPERRLKREDLPTLGRPTMATTGSILGIFAKSKQGLYYQTMDIPINLESKDAPKLVVVTKNRSVKEIEKAISKGITCIGENRIQEAKEKFAKLTIPVEKHFIGHLQTNKVKQAIELFDWIESVDSIRLAQKINIEAEKQEKCIPILLQVNIAEDPNKYGFTEQELPEILKTLHALPYLDIRGLMTIVPYEEDPEKTRPHFQKMKQLQKALNLSELSMGMSNDYEIAIQEGATIVRIGSAIFES